MKYVLPASSLQNLASVSLVVELWNGEDVRTRIANFDLGEDYPRRRYDDMRQYAFEASQVKSEKWKKIEDKVVEKASALSSTLPESLKPLLINIVKPLGMEIIKWWDYNHEENFRFVTSFPEKLCWTAHGTVDYKRTAEIIVMNEKIQLEARYKLACIYCFEKEIRVLWRLIPEERQKEMLKAIKLETRTRIRYYEEYPDVPDRTHSRDLIDFWTCAVSNANADEITQLTRRKRMRSYDPEQFAFRCAVYSSNLTATEFWFNRLSRKGKNLMRRKFLTQYLDRLLWLNYYRFLNRNTQVVVFLLGIMNEDEEERAFQKVFLKILENFMGWPWQGLVVETAKRWWHFLDHNDPEWVYSALLQALTAEKISEGYKDYDYSEMFREIWALSSPSQKDDFFRMHQTAFEILVNLFKAKEEGLVKLILRELDEECVEKLIFSVQQFKNDFPNPFLIVIYLEKFDFLTFLLEERFIPSVVLLKYKRTVDWQLPLLEDRVRENSETFIRFVEEFVENPGPIKYKRKEGEL